MASCISPTCAYTSATCPWTLVNTLPVLHFSRVGFDCCPSSQSGSTDKGHWHQWQERKECIKTWECLSEAVLFSVQFEISLWHNRDMNLAKIHRIDTKACPQGIAVHPSPSEIPRDSGTMTVCAQKELPLTKVKSEARQPAAQTHPQQ